MTTHTDLNSIEPPDCYARMQQIREEVELVRMEMGRRASGLPEVVVANAAPREAYFVALTLFRKADRLSFELTGDELFSLPVIPSVAKIRPGHVLRVLSAAQAEIRNVCTHLSVPESVPAPAREATRTPSDVVSAGFAVNRTLNQLLQQPFSPSDVNQQLAVARDLTSAVLHALGGDASEVPVPAFERRRRPMDVFGQLLAALETLRAIAKRSGLEMLEIRSGLTPSEDIQPGDVFDLSALVLAEVSYLHAFLTDAPAPEVFASHHLGRKLPSHCFQTAQHLNAILKSLHTRVEARPDWAKTA